jgi:predicted nucleic acid-binding protein
VIAIDTNLLVFAHRGQAPEHKAARAAIEKAAQAPDGWGWTLSNLLEFWSVVTHPSAPPRPSTPAEASAFLQALVRDADANIWLPGEGFDRRLIGLASKLRIKGPRIFDLTIALTAYEAGAREIWTHDLGFQSVPGLRAAFPLIQTAVRR